MEDKIRLELRENTGPNSREIVVKLLCSVEGKDREETYVNAINLVNNQILPALLSAGIHLEYEIHWFCGEDFGECLE